jgi:hypothetical protein
MRLQSFRRTEKNDDITSMEQTMKKNIPISFFTLFRSKDNINIRNVRLDHLKYMLIFPLAPVFANMQGALFSDSIRLFGLDAMTLMGSAYCIGAGALFAFSNVKNMAKVSHIFAIVTAAAYIPWIAMGESRLSLLLAILFMFFWEAVQPARRLPTSSL